MYKVVLQVGGADFEQLLAAVVQNDLGIGKEHKIKALKPQRLYISYSRGDECSFRFNAVLVVGAGLRIIKFEQHNGEGRSVRKLQIRTAFINSITDTVEKFVVCEGGRAGNAAALQQTGEGGCRN